MKIRILLLVVACVLPACGPNEQEKRVVEVSEAYAAAYTAAAVLAEAYEAAAKETYEVAAQEAYEPAKATYEAEARAHEAIAAAYRAKGGAWEISIIASLAWDARGENDGGHSYTEQLASQAGEWANNQQAKFETEKERQLMAKITKFVIAKTIGLGIKSATKIPTPFTTVVLIVLEQNIRLAIRTINTREEDKNEAACDESSKAREEASVSWAAASEAAGNMIRAQLNETGRYADLWEQAAMAQGVAAEAYEAAAEAYETLAKTYETVAEAYEAAAEAYSGE